MRPSHQRVAARHMARYVSTPWKQIERFADAFDDAYRSKELDEMGPLLGRDDHSHALAQDGLAVWMLVNYGSFGEVLRLAFRKLHDEYMFSGLGTDWDRWWQRVGRVRDEIKKKLAEAGPSHFRWRGFLIQNPERLSDQIVERGLDHAAHVLALFRKRGVEDALVASVKVWRFDLADNYSQHGSAGGWYDSRDQSVTFAYGKKWGKETYETLIHEIGHHLHLRYLHGEARAAWDAPWADVPEEYDRWLGQMMGPNRDRAKAVDRLDVPTEYARTNVFEDFAETFTAFVLRPNTLSPLAKFRMQRALSLSNLYGKKVMRLSAESVASKFLE